MTIIEESQYLQIVHDSSIKALIYSLKKGNYDMFDEDYKAGILRVLAASQVHRPLTVIANSYESEFTVSIELQDWLNNEVAVKIPPTGAKHMVIVPSKDFIVRLSVEQAVDDSAKPITITFATSLEDARRQAADNLQKHLLP
ncbi:hypothetical protein [Eisenibacter elegans]|jgi:hypothetical protein|uniref:hypothetical protein n=1 Tax=Eisenibacter elegans TaxID=997 RepID=UPI00040480B1|nr:hypothetical protein [Eisenibacter elegans]